MKIENENGVKFFKELQNAIELNVKIDKPAKHLNESTIFRAPQCKEDEVKKMLEKQGVETFEMSPISQMRRSLGFQQQDDKNFNLTVDQFDFNVIIKRYLNGNEIEIYLDKIAEIINNNCPNIEAKVDIENFSYEKRAIKSITISYRNKLNPTVVIDAGVHAREWHSRSLALYTLKNLMFEALLDTNGLIFKANFIIVANVNPDGYHYSRTVVRN